MTSPRIHEALESYDLQCAFHRWELTQDPGEIAALTTPQLFKALYIIRADSTWPIWQYLERRLGRTITPQEVSHGK